MTAPTFDPAVYLDTLEAAGFVVDARMKPKGDWQVTAAERRTTSEPSRAIRKVRRRRNYAHQWAATYLKQAGAEGSALVAAELGRRARKQPRSSGLLSGARKLLSKLINLHRDPDG